MLAIAEWLLVNHCLDVFREGMGTDANDIVRRAWRDLPSGDRILLEAISADQWQVCEQALGTYADAMLRSAGRVPLPEAEIARANDALALWVPQLRVVLINESHPAFDGLDGPTLTYDLSRVAWHEWGHALSIDRAGEEDIAAGERYLALLPDGLAEFIRQAGYRRREYTHEVVAEIYADPDDLATPRKRPEGLHGSIRRSMSL